MDLVIPGNYYIEIPRIIDLKDIEIAVEDFTTKNGVLEININVNSTFYRGTYDEDLKDSQKKLITLLVDSEIELNNIEFNNVKGEVVMNQGVEIVYDMRLFYSEILQPETIVDVIDHEKDLLLEKELLLREVQSTDYEEPEDEVSEDQSIDLVEYVDDEDGETLIELDDSYTTIKFISVNNEKELETISTKYDIPLRDIYSQNNFNISNRVVIQINE